MARPFAWRHRECVDTQFVMAESLGMVVKFYDTVTKLPLGNASQVGSMQELLGQSDIISLHVPENASTQDMIGAEQLEQMKQGSILINAARGTVIDIDALCATLETGKLLGAAIDVFPVEPKSNKEEFISPLRAFDNVILTPHVGGQSDKYDEEALPIAAANLKCFVEDRMDEMNFQVEL